MFFCIPCSNTKILFSKNRKEREVFCFVYSYYEWKPYQHSLFKIRTLYIPLGVDWGSVLGRYCSYSVLRNFGSEIRSENSYLTNLQQVTLREKSNLKRICLIICYAVIVAMRKVSLLIQNPSENQLKSQNLVIYNLFQLLNAQF